jgi:hypothetical protein
MKAGRKINLKQVPKAISSSKIEGMQVVKSRNYQSEFCTNSTKGLIKMTSSFLNTVLGASFNSKYTMFRVRALGLRKNRIVLK